MREIASVAAHQIDEGRVIDEIIRLVAMRRLLEIDAIGAGGGGGLLGAAGERRQSRVEIRGIELQLLHRVALGIDGDEDRLHAGGAVAQRVERRTHGLQRGRTGIRAEGVAEIDQHQLAAEVAVVADDAVLIDQGERPADRYAKPAAAVARAKPPMIEGEGARDQQETGDEDDEAAAGSGRHVRSYARRRRASCATPRGWLMTRLYRGRGHDGNFAP